ncbi:sigma-70 family RNA polymerase sigma factor [Xylophilus sp.]|uniref:sigma-70 family RNA polymerase sigma factor n=1 Tax=Xylophilus sp. TaxID=2653893 RepID=UPI0013BE865E|nr:sigma-70 family RNA polymerase sigma factor [Xylophilus sp.]KAF1048781.1 MAG: Protein FecR [Xylophilus sp.]
MTVSASPLHASFHRSYQQLVQFLARKTGNADDARELAQDLWLQLHSRAAARPADPQAYLFTMARNLAVDHLRRQRLADQHAEAWLALHPGEPAAADGAQLLAQRRLLQAVGAALAALPRRTREVFVAHRIEGVGQDELARLHGVTRSTIERDVQRAGQAVDGVLARWHASAGAAAAQGPRRRGLAGALLGIGALAGSGGLAWSWWRLHIAQWQAAVVSAVGRQRMQTLPDGTHLTLDAASAADIAYYAARRHVRLQRGAAFFEVAHDAARPFVVDAGAVRVTVLGTRFSVDLQDAGGAVEVGVESGRVRVEPAADGGSWQPLLLAAGDVVRLAPGEPPRAVPRAAQGVAAWRDGWLGFRDAPLGEVAARLRRYTDTGIAVSDAAARLPVTAEIRSAQAGEWLRRLPAAMPVEVDWQAGRPARVAITERAARR